MDRDEYATSRPITFEAQSAPEVVETVEIEGKPVAIVRYATLEMPRQDSTPVFGRTGDFYAMFAGAEVHTLSRTFYLNRGRFHDVGQGTGGHAIARVKGGELARAATVKGAIKAARDRIERRRLHAQYAPVAEANIGSHTRADFEALDADAEIEPGDLVVVVSHSMFRTGVAVKVTKTRVECLAATPTGRVANGATRTKGTQVRLLRKATPAAPAAPAVEEVTPAEPAPAGDLALLGQAVRARAERVDGSAPAAPAIAEVTPAEPRTQRRIPGGRPTAAQGRFLAALPVDGSPSRDGMQAVSTHAPINAAIARGWTTQEPWGDGTGRGQHRITPDGLWAIGRESEAAALRSVELAAARVAAEGWGEAPEEGPESRDCVRVYVQSTPTGREQWCATHRAFEPIPATDDGPVLDADEDRRAAAGRVFARAEGVTDAGDGCTLYRMVRARVGAREVRIHDAGGELLGTVREGFVDWVAQTPTGEDLAAPDGGLVSSFADAVATVRAAATGQGDDQGATVAAREGDDMGETETPAADHRAALLAELLGDPAALRAVVDQASRAAAGLDPAVLRAVADEIERARAGHVTEIEAAGVIVHKGVGVQGHNLPRRTLSESLSWDGGAWQLPEHGSNTEVGEDDVAGAQAWAAGVIESRTRLLPYGLVPVDRMPDGGAARWPAPQVTGWKQHRDDHGDWWEPVAR